MNKITALLIIILSFTNTGRAKMWREVMPQTAIFVITAKNITHFYNYSTITLIAATDMPNGKKGYVFLGAGHSLNRDRMHPVPMGPPVEIEEEFSINLFYYDDLGRQIATGSISETDPDTVFAVDSSNKKDDVGLLVVTTTKDLEIKPAKLIHESLTDTIELEQELFIGSASCFPLPSFKSGKVSIIPNDRLFMVEAGVAGGASGGGLYNDSGEYVGMISGVVCGDFVIAAVSMNVIYDFFRSRELILPNMCGGEDAKRETKDGGQSGSGGSPRKESNAKESGSDRVGTDSGDSQAEEEEEKEEDGRQEKANKKEIESHLHSSDAWYRWGRGKKG